MKHSKGYDNMNHLKQTDKSTYVNYLHEAKEFIDWLSATHTDVTRLSDAKHFILEYLTVYAK